MSSRATRPALVEPAPNDDDLLDAYSRAVVDVVDRIGPAVASLTLGRRGRRPDGEGSGVVVAPDGYLLTNSHVVKGRSNVSVTLDRGRCLGGRVVGDDPATDLALVRVDGSSLPFALLDETVTARSGQLAIAIGNPLGFQSTVSTGVVSAVGRSLRGRNSRLIDDVLQHTAPLNPGSSGGALADSRGRILGINTAMIPRSQGIGFAIAASTAAWVLTQLLTRGRVRRAVLGIGAQTRPLDRRLAHHHGLALATAVEILAVEKRSAAARAGLRDGDILVAFAGRAVATIEDLLRMLRDWQPGQPVALRILRRGRAMEISASPSAS